MRISLTAGALATAAILVLAPGAAADQTYSDPAGDATGGAPDITTVQVKNDAAGQISFDITVPLPAPDYNLGGERTFVAVAFDTDRNRTTGDDGDDYGLQYFANADIEMLFRWTGSTMQPVPAPSLNVSYANGVFHFDINKSDLGNTEAFDFWAVAFKMSPDGEELGWDEAPDGMALWSYTVTEPPPPPPPPLTLNAGKPKALKAPQAGKAFTVVMPVKRSDGATFTKGTVTGSMKIGAKTLKAKGRVVKGTARCTTRIPAGTKGKILRGKITAQVGTAKVTKSFAFTIR